MPVMINCPHCQTSFQSTFIQAKTEQMFRTNPVIGGEIEETCPKCGTTFKHDASSYYWVD
ncbi:MAG: hypothetical protein ACHQ1H_14400 [Nitrososphaerales archaeon]